MRRVGIHVCGKPARRFDRVVLFPPSVDPAEERPDAAETAALETQRHSSRRDFVGARAVNDDVAYSREEYPDYHEHFAAIFAGLKIKPNIVEEHDGAASLLPAIEAGTGVALVTESFACNAGPRVKLLRLTPEPPPGIVGIAALVGPMTPAAERFRQCAKEAAK